MGGHAAHDARLTASRRALLKANGYALRDAVRRASAAAWPAIFSCACAWPGIPILR